MGHLDESAITEVRKTATVLLGVCILWLFTSGAVKAALLKRHGAANIAAWLALHEALAGKESSLIEPSGAGTINCFTRTIPIQSGTEIEECVPILLHQPWPGAEVVSLSLTRVNADVPAFRVAAKATLPADSYIVWVVSQSIFVIPKAYLPKDFSPRDLYSALGNHMAVPLDWSATRTYLQSEGWSGKEAPDLRLNDNVVAAFIQQGFTSSSSISGVPVPSGLYPAALDTFLGLLAFTLVGPYIALRRSARIDCTDAWVMLARSRGHAGLLLRYGQVLILVLVALLPLGVGFTQAWLFPLLVPLERTLWALALAGPLCACIMTLAVGKNLLRLRDISTKPQ